MSTVYYKLSHSFSLRDYRVQSCLFGHGVNEAIGEIILDDGIRGIDIALKKNQLKATSRVIKYRIFKKAIFFFLFLTENTIYFSYFS